MCHPSSSRKYSPALKLSPGATDVLSATSCTWRLGPLWNSDAKLDGVMQMSHVNAYVTEHLHTRARHTSNMLGRFPCESNGHQIGFVIDGILGHDPRQYTDMPHPYKKHCTCNLFHSMKESIVGSE